MHPPSNLPPRDPAAQFEWHEAYRDSVKNMYRTTYTDASHFRETYVKSDYPAGYGGHIPAVRHDVLHRNTEFDRKQTLMRSDPSRDAKPSFVDQIAGIPTITKYPCGAKHNPTYKVVYRDGTTAPLAPWGVTSNNRREALNQRTMPATMKRTVSMPGLGRSNQAGMGAGSMIAGPDVTEMRMSPSSGQLQGASQQMMEPPTMMSPGQMMSPGSNRLQRTVDFANQEAMMGEMPSEADILHEHMRQ